MNAIYSILCIRVEASELMDYNRSIMPALRQLYPDVEIFEIDNFSSSFILNTTIEELKNKENLVLVFDVNTATENNLMPVFKVANSLLRTRKKIHSFHNASHPKLNVLFNKLKSKLHAPLDNPLVDLERTINEISQ